MRKNILKRLHDLDNNPQSGFAFVLIIIIVVLIFSITLVSGADDFVLSEEAPRDSSSGGTTPTPTLTLTPTPATSGSAVNEDLPLE